MQCYASFQSTTTTTTTTTKERKKKRRRYCLSDLEMSARAAIKWDTDQAFRGIASEERLAWLARDSVKVVAQGTVTAHPAVLVFLALPSLAAPKAVHAHCWLHAPEGRRFHGAGVGVIEAATDKTYALNEKLYQHLIFISTFGRKSTQTHVWTHTTLHMQAHTYAHASTCIQMQTQSMKTLQRTIPCTV